MSSTAGATRKLSSEVVEFMEDKIASLRAAGRVAEAEEEAGRLARLQKEHSFNAKNASLDESIDPVEKAGKDWTSDSFQRPAAPGAPEAANLANTSDFTDWKSKLPTGGDAQNMLSADVSQMGDEGRTSGMLVRRKAAAGAGLAAAGLAASSTLGNNDVNAPLTPPTGQEEKKEDPQALALGAKAGVSAERITPPEIKDVLSNLAAPPSAPSLDQWDSKLSDITDQRQSRINQLKGDILNAQAAADASSSSIDRRELIETITNAIGQIAAGAYGMKSGLDMSGVKFNKTDWNSKLDRVHQQLKDNISRLTDEQQLDQGVLSEKKDALLRNKDDLIKKYEMAYHNWSGKAEIAKAKQGLETDKAKLTYDSQKTNAELDLKAQEAMEKAAAKGLTARDQVSAGIKEANKSKDELMRRWNQLASDLGSEKVGDDQKRAKKAEMQGLDAQYTAITGTPILPDIKNGMPTLTPRDYSKVDASDLIGAAEGRYKNSVETAVAAFQNPALQQIKGAYVQQRDQYIASFAQEYLNKHEPAASAFAKARQRYNAGLQSMFTQEAAFRQKQGVK